MIGMSRPKPASRRRAMAQMRAQGMTYEQIAQAWGLKKQRIWQILNPKPAAVKDAR
jgi:hypothetical protein